MATLMDAVEDTTDPRDLQEKVAAKVANDGELSDVEREQVAAAIQSKAKRAKPEAPAPVEEPAVEAPAPKAVTLEAVRARLGELSSDGKKEEIKSLFAKFGVAKLTELEPEKFGELLAAAEAL